MRLVAPLLLAKHRYAALAVLPVRNCGRKRIHPSNIHAQQHVLEHHTGTVRCSEISFSFLPSTLVGCSLRGVRTVEQEQADAHGLGAHVARETGTER